MFFVFSIGPNYLLYPNQPNSSFTDNQVVSSTLKIWYQFRRRFKFISASTSAPLLKNHLFKPAFTDSTFSVWHGKGLIFFKNLYRDGIFRSFTDLSCVYQLPSSHLFRYFQIRHCQIAISNLPLLTYGSVVGRVSLFQPLSKISYF